jgi:predicted phage tail protein
MKRILRRLVVPAMATTLTLTATPAHAQTRFVTDSYNESSPAFNVKNARFSYTESSAVFRVKFENLNRRRTALVVRYYAPNYTIQVMTKYVNGRKKVIVHRYDDMTHMRIPNRQISSHWNSRTDVIRVLIAERHLEGSRADFHAWSQAKNAMHGKSFGDELYVARLRRG